MRLRGQATDRSTLADGRLIVGGQGDSGRLYRLAGCLLQVEALPAPVEGIATNMVARGRESQSQPTAVILPDVFQLFLEFIFRILLCVEPVDVRAEPILRVALSNFLGIEGVMS